MSPDWSIQARARRCDLTGQPFADGERFFTLLYRDEKVDTLRRRDVSAAGWRTLQNDSSAEAPFSFWRSKYAPPPPAAPEALPRADAETLLRRFLTEGQPGQARAAYILALMLERKKLLRPTAAQADGAGRRKLLFYEHTKTGETFVITDPDLRLDQIAEVQREVAELLKTDLGTGPNMGSVGAEH